jgi:hypothetical protein
MEKRRCGMINRKGQAAAELAILGILILTAFSFIMSFGQSLGAYQQTKMETFRKALQKAWYRNASVNYTFKNDSRAASATSGFYQGSGLSPESNASVTWQKGRAGDYGTKNQTSFAFWQINDQMVNGTPHDTTGLTGDISEYGLPLNLQYTYDATGGKSDQEMLIPASAWKNNLTRTENYDYDLKKTESHSGITYDKTATLTDSTAGTVYMHFNTAIDEEPADDEPEDPIYVDAGSAAYSTSNTYEFQAGWTVPHDGNVIPGAKPADNFWWLSQDAIDCIRSGGYYDGAGTSGSGVSFQGDMSCHAHVGGDLAAARDAQRAQLREYDCNWLGGSFDRTTNQCTLVSLEYWPSDYAWASADCVSRLNGQWSGGRCVYHLENVTSRYANYNSCFSVGGFWDGASCWGSHNVMDY